jgi:hypothetical protein
MERQNLFSKVKEKILLVLFYEIKQRWRKEAYVNCFFRKKRSEIAWWRVGIWKTRGIKKGSVKGRCPLCYKQEGDKLTLLTSMETTKWREKLMCKK